MPSNFSFCHIEKCNNGGSLSFRYAHNFRTVTSESLRHVNPDLTHLNHDLVLNNPVPYEELVEHRFQEVQLQTGSHPKKRKDAVPALEVFLSFSHGANERNGFTIEEWEKESYQWLKDYFGQENVLSVMVHMDEFTPHIHALVTPFTKDLRLCAKEFTGGPKAMRAIVESYSSYFTKAPFCLTKPVGYAKAAYESLDKFHRAINTIEDTVLPERGIESEEEYHQKVIDYIKTKEMQALEEVHQKNIQVGHLRANIFTLKKKYKKAIHLYDYLCNILPNIDAVEEELENLCRLEALPREEIKKIIAECKDVSKTTKEYNEGE